MAAVHLPHHRVGVANPCQDRNDGAKAEESDKERQEGHDANGHQRGPKARQNDQLPIATEKLLRPAQRGPHDRLFCFFHSHLRMEGRSLECSSSSPVESFIADYPRAIAWTGWRMAIS